jgi:hypothetical protein
MEYSKNDWMDLSSAKLFIADDAQFFYNHSKEILEFNGGLIDKFKSSLSKEILINTMIRKKGKLETFGIEAGNLNSQIRMLLTENFNNIKLEVNEINGVYYFSSNKDKKQIAGFDFALLNSKNNLIKLRNLCFGELKYSDGKKRWDKFLNVNTNLIPFSKEILRPDMFGENISSLNSDTPLILGEIQFGNWGLVYRDFFKLLKANVQTSVDCLVYVVCHGQLEKMLSDGIVTFDKTVKLLKEFSKVVNVPIWVVGLDIKV